jgi:carbonic anhydrase/acetyltransferase-like protein (isoleucine patch superfamily)
MALYQLEDEIPRVDTSAWVAPSAQVMGRVHLHAHSSIWYGAVLRGDNDLITIGARSNVQDNSVLHTDHGMPLVLGQQVTVGHQVMLHGCWVGDGSLIGIQSIVLNGARIGRNCLVGAGSLVTEGKEFPDGSLIIGRPAKLVRPLTEDEVARLAASALHYVQQAERHRVHMRQLEQRPLPADQR